MKLIRITVVALIGLLVTSAGTAHAQLVASTFVINELDSVQTGGNTRQFIELFNGGLAPVNLSEYSLGFYDGDAANNARYLSIALTGTLTPGGYYVVGNSGVANVNQTFAAGTLKTGVDAVILYHGSTAPAVPSPTDILNFTDAIVYGQSQATDLDLLTATGEAPFQYNEDFGALLGGPSAGGASLSRVNGVDAIPFQIGTPTPGAANQNVIPLPAIIPVPEPGSATALGLLAAARLLRRQRR